MKIVFICGDYRFDFGENWKHVPPANSRVIHGGKIYDVVRNEFYPETDEARVILIEGQEYGVERSINN